MHGVAKALGKLSQEGKEKNVETYKPGSTIRALR
jgi:hypothetical protein